MNSHSAVDTALFAELQATVGSEFAAELVGTFAEEAPALFAELHAARAAGAAERFRRAAHSLKSNAGTFGAARLAEAARALELAGPPAEPAALDALDALAREFDVALVALRELAHG